MFPPIDGREITNVDYLQPAGNTARRLAAIACLPAALLSGAIAVVSLAAMIQRWEFVDREGRPVWVGVVICGLIAVACGWCCVRLWGYRPASGVTLLPIWMIELIGLVLMVSGLFFVFWQEKLWWGLSSCGVALAMLTIRRTIRQRDMLTFPARQVDEP